MIIWRDYVSVAGDLCSPFLPERSGDLFLRQLLEMPTSGKSPLSYDEAQRLFGGAVQDWCEKNLRGLDAWNSDPKVQAEDMAAAYAFEAKMVQWLSEHGYYIHLDGTEYQSTQRVALQ